MKLTSPAPGEDAHALPDNCTRGITYYLEVLTLLAPFSKSSFTVHFTGGVITSATAEGDSSVDTFRAVFLPQLTTRFDISRNIDVRVIKRSATGFPLLPVMSPGL